MTAGLYVIGKLFRFEATRRVGGGYDGHSFVAEIVLSAAELTKVGFVTDFGDLAPLKTYIDATLDHQMLSDVLDDASDEGIADHLYQWGAANLPDSARPFLEAVRVRTGRTAARVGTASAVDFEASHRLDGLAEGHPCGRLHGHSYLLALNAGPGRAARAVGVPVVLRRYIQSTLAGALLNDVLSFNPTCELLAEHIGIWLCDRRPAGVPGQTTVRVSETETSWAEYPVRSA
ncbi:MAG: 6-pyruvoyl trahydropterin synthase family protein [Pseudonocardiaceae bacterium]